MDEVKINADFKKVSYADGVYKRRVWDEEIKAHSYGLPCKIYESVQCIRVDANGDGYGDLRRRHQWINARWAPYATMISQGSTHRNLSRVICEACCDAIRGRGCPTFIDPLDPNHGITIAGFGQPYIRYDDVRAEWYSQDGKKVVLDVLIDKAATVKWISQKLKDDPEWRLGY